MIRLSLLPPEHENDNMPGPHNFRTQQNYTIASIQVLLTMFAQDSATAQPPRPWRMYLLMALKSWTIFSERSLDAKLELLLLTQKTSANFETHMVCRYSVEPAATCFNMSTWIECDDCDLHYASIVQH